MPALDPGGPGPTAPSASGLSPGFAEEAAAPHPVAVADPTPTLLRLVGLLMLVVAIPVHNVFLMGRFDSRRWLMFGGLVAVYGFGVWILAQRTRGPDPARRYADLLTAFDVVPAAATVYLAGGARSWIFGAVLLPGFTRLGHGPLAVSLLSLLGVVAYAGLIVIVGPAGVGSVDWTSQTGRLTLLLFGSALLTVAAWTVSRQREQATDAARDAQHSIDELHADASYLDATRRQAESESLARSEFLSRVGHELRPVLRDLLRAARDLERDARSDVQVANAHEIGNKGRHLLDVINEVIDLARVETGFLARDLSSVAVLPALQDVLDRASPAADRRSIRIEATELPASDVFVLANDRKLRQVFANLISNAVKYNSSPGRIEVRCRRHSDRLRIAVTDTGPGIPSDRVEEAFAPFERLGAEATDVKGTGLGLPLARALVEAMEGRMEVEPGPDGAGTTVWFELRLEPAAPTGPGDMDDEPGDT